MSAGAGDGDLEAMRGDALGGDVLDGCAVHRDYSGQMRAVAFHQRANSAEIAFAFFADVSREDDCFRRANARFGKRARQTDESGETSAVVRDAGGLDAMGVALGAHAGGSGKNRIEMRCKKDDGARIRAGALADHIADVVRADLEAAGFEKFLEEFAATRFAEFGRGNFGEADLLIRDPIGIFADPVESARAAWIHGELFNRIVGGARGKCDHQKKDTADEREFHVFRRGKFSSELQGQARWARRATVLCRGLSVFGASSRVTQRRRRLPKRNPSVGGHAEIFFVALEDGREIGHKEELDDSLIGVDYLEFALFPLRADPQPHDGPQT